ncbi:CRISPR-associated RAMP protein Csx10 [bacterium]|nr:CRISPR-associated RAMP protein Csx10 [bacterium]MBU1613923.1 CRISPR-associated RAMP protein Csx10 [bacterium]
MNKYQMNVTLLSPVCIAQKRGTGNIIETLDYIPGSTIRGALAMLYIRQRGTDADFYRIFTSDNVRFGNCYPEGAKVIPSTTASCKYNKGFSTSRSPGDGKHGVWDILAEMAKYEVMQDKLAKNFEYCEDCPSVMDRFSGYYLQEGEDNFSLVKASKRLVARTAIMDTLETALPANLYTLEVLNEKKEEGNVFVPQEFIGEFETDNTNWFDELNNLLSQHGNEMRIGIGKSRGLGEVDIKLDCWPSAWQKWEKPISERLDELNKNKKLEVPGGYFFSVTLHADAILLDKILRFKSTLETCDLVETLGNLSTPLCPNSFNLFGKTISEFRHHRNWLSTHFVAGWNTALKLPKEDAVAISKGSVFLFRIDRTLSDTEKTNLAQMLELIEQAGIGERCNEGFGKIRVCDEFHLKEYK